MIFVFSSHFLCILVLEGDFGCISGCIVGFGGVLYLVWGTYDRKSWVFCRAGFIQRVCKQRVATFGGDRDDNTMTYAVPLRNKEWDIPSV